MATVQDDILKAFYEKLGKLATVDGQTVKAIRQALESGNKLKAEDFVVILVKSQTDGVA